VLGSRATLPCWREAKLCSGKGDGIVSLLAVEYVSKYGGEYDTKMQNYADVGVTYYVIYNPEYTQRHKHNPARRCIAWSMGRMCYNPVSHFGCGGARHRHWQRSGDLPGGGQVTRVAVLVRPKEG